MGPPVVGQWHQLGLGVPGVEVDDGVPHLTAPVVGRPAQSADVDHQAPVDPLQPRQAGVGATQHVGPAGLDPQPDLVVVERLPEEVVEHQRRAVHEVDVVALDDLAVLGGQGAHPGGELGAGVRLGEVVDQLGELVVARVAVAATAVVVAPADGHVVVAGDALHAVVDQQRPHCVGLGSETAQIAQAEQALTASAPGVVEEGAQGVGVRVHAAADPDPHRSNATTAV